MLHLLLYFAPTAQRHYNAQLGEEMEHKVLHYVANGKFQARLNFSICQLLLVLLNNHCSFRINSVWTQGDQQSYWIFFVLSTVQRKLRLLGVLWFTRSSWRLGFTKWSLVALALIEWQTFLTKPWWIHWRTFNEKTLLSPLLNWLIYWVSTLHQVTGARGVISWSSDWTFWHLWPATVK